MIEAEENKEYLPIDGLADFKKATLQLLLGSGHPAIKEVGPSCVRASICQISQMYTASHCRVGIMTTCYAAAKACSAGQPST